MINTAGIYDIAADEYHADPCLVPSLSRGIAHLLITRSPMHGHYCHPRLGAGDNIKVSKVMDAGTAVHSMVLGKGAQIVSLTAVYGEKHALAGQPVRDFATKAAQEERDALREAGHIPCLQHEVPALRKAGVAIVKHLRWHQDGADFFSPGQSEAVIVWREEDVWLRIMIDRLPDDPRAPPYDLKLTKLAATPAGWERQMREKYAFQDAFYRRGIRAVRGIEPPPMRFVVGELDAPHGVSIMCAAPSLAALADAEVECAIGIWRKCIADDRWPGYPLFTAHIEAPSWMLNRAEDQKICDEMLVDQT